MATEEAFLRAICEEPDRNDFRLVYADWLEERGEPRGEFVRLQCQLADMDPDDPRRPGLEARERELLEEYGGRWLGCAGVVWLPAPPNNTPWRAVVATFRRGFPHVLTAPAVHWIACGKAILKLETVRAVVILDAGTVERRDGESAADFMRRCDLVAAGQVFAAVVPALTGAFQPLVNAFRQVGVAFRRLPG